MPGLGCEEHFRFSVVVRLYVFKIEAILIDMVQGL